MTQMIDLALEIEWARSLADLSARPAHARPAHARPAHERSPQPAPEISPLPITLASDADPELTALLEAFGGENPFA